MKSRIVFSLIILLAAGLRFSSIGFDSLWLDESYQSMVGAFGHGPVLLTADKGQQKFLFRFERPAQTTELLRNFRSVDPLCPPLYAVLLNKWMQIFGSGDFAVRALSSLFSTATVALICYFGSLILSPRAAIFAGLLAACSPFDIHYAQEARMYSLVELTGLLSGASLLLLIKEGLGSAKAKFLLPLYAVSTAAMINSHYTSLFQAAAEGFLATGYLLFARQWKLLLALCACWIATALLWMPWLPMFLVSAGSRKESFYVSHKADLLWAVCALFIRVPVNWLSFLCGQRVVAYAIPTYFTGAFMLLYSLKELSKSSKDRFALIALWLWAIVPAGGLWLIDVMENHRVIEVARYSFFTAPAIFMLAGYGLGEALSWRRAFTWVAIGHFLFAGVNFAYNHIVHQREPWKEMAATVEQNVPEDEPLLISQHYDLICLDRYLHRARLQQGVSPAMGQDAINKILDGKTRFALLTAQEGEQMAAMIPSRYDLVKRFDYSHGLHLRIYQEKAAPPPESAPSPEDGRQD